MVDAGPVMTKPRFNLNQDFPPDMLYEPSARNHKNLPSTLNYLKDSSHVATLITGKSSPGRVPSL